MTLLDEYRRKRDFKKTSEPPPKVEKWPSTARSFVIQKHDATRIHYDLRLEMDGVLKSWAVPKGPSLDPSVKRLAVRVEDHPLAYGSFEGTIPEGEYGAGPVLLWDQGSWQPDDGNPLAALERGHLSFTLKGAKLHGRWHLVRTRGDTKTRAHGDAGRTWLLIKAADDDVRQGVGVGELDERSVTTGRTIEDVALAPELCTPVREPPAGDDWLHEPKIDGYRMLAKKDGASVQLLTRNGLDWTERFPSVAAAMKKLSPARVILDGEIALIDANGAVSFGALQRAIVGANERASTVFFAFDCLSLEGTDLRDRPLSERKQHLAGVVRPTRAGRKVAAIERMPFVVGHGAAFLEEMKKQGLEGMVSKRIASTYVGERTHDWLKVRLSSREDFVVVGHTPEKNGRGLGALLVATNEGEFRGRVGTGYSQQDREELAGLLAPLAEKRRDEWPLVAHATWVKPLLVVEVEYKEVTASGRLRHPVFLGLRRDKTHLDEGPARRVWRSRRAEGDRSDTAPAGISITHPDRVLFHVGEQSIDKLSVARFVEAMTPLMLPFVKGRPLAVVRCPNGLGAGRCFFQKHPIKGMPEAIKTIGVGTGEEEMLTVDDAAGLVGLVQMGALEFHSWGAREGDPETPDRVIFDLDPAEGLDWGCVVEAARKVREHLDARGLKSFVKTTGGKGLHVVMPLSDATTWDEVKSFALGVAQAIERDEPDRYTSNMRKTARLGRVFIDYLRNGRGATAIAPFSVRARPGAKVAVPVSWDELDDVRGDTFDMLNLVKRLVTVDDPWADYDAVKQGLPAR